MTACLTFDAAAWHFQATGLENFSLFFKLLGGSARASACASAEFMIKRGSAPSFGAAGSIPVVSPTTFSSSSCADITHAATLVRFFPRDFRFFDFFDLRVLESR